MKIALMILVIIETMIFMFNNDDFVKLMMLQLITMGFVVMK